MIQRDSFRRMTKRKLTKPPNRTKGREGGAGGEKFCLWYHRRHRRRLSLLCRPLVP